MKYLKRGASQFVSLHSSSHLGELTSPFPNACYSVKVVSELTLVKGSRMAKYYYTTSFEDPAVYHHSHQCEEGKKIETKSRVNTDYLPSARRLCEVC